MRSPVRQLSVALLGAHAACPGPWQLRATAASSTTAAQQAQDIFGAPLAILSQWWQSLQRAEPSGALVALNEQGLLEHAAGGRRLLYAEFQQGVRTRLAIDAAAHVTVRTGAMELTRVRVVEDEAGEASELRISAEAASGTDCVTIGTASGSGAPGGEISRQILAEIPERYATVDIRSHGGDVTVEAVNEAGLSVDSGGGSVRLGKVKASRATVSAGGGGCAAKLLVAEAVEVEAGSVQIERLMGKQAAVVQQQQRAADGFPEPLRIRAAYVQDSLALDAGDADIEIGTLACEPGLAQLSTGGGVAIDCLDGRASIAAAGNASLHCHDGLRALLLAAGGRVALRLSPALAKSAVVRAPAGLFLPGLPDGVQLLPEAGFELFDPEDVAAVGEALGVPVLQLRVGPEAQVSVEVESWMQALGRRAGGGGQ